MRLGAKGIKVEVSGRLGSAEIAHAEWYREGRVPLHTLPADIDCKTPLKAHTIWCIGVKVWIFKGEIFGWYGCCWVTGKTGCSTEKAACL